MARAQRDAARGTSFAAALSTSQSAARKTTSRDENHVARTKRTVEPEKQVLGCVAALLRKKFNGQTVITLPLDRNWAEEKEGVRNRELARQITEKLLPLVDNKHERICPESRLAKLTEDAIFNALSAGKTAPIRTKSRCEPASFVVWTPHVKAASGTDGRPDARIKRMRQAAILRKAA